MSMVQESLPARPRRDWSARSRSTASDALRYTRFVVRMKRVLLFSAFAVIFAVLGFFAVQRAPRQFSLSYERMGSIQNDRAMIKPRLSGVDAKGNPFVITAAELVQDAKNSKRATLKIVEADMSQKAGWINVRAGMGVADMQAGHIELSGGIELFADSGYQLSTASAAVDTKGGIVTGSQEVRGQGPLGSMRADSFRYDRNTGRLTLMGHVHLAMTGKLP